MLPRHQVHSRISQTGSSELHSPHYLLWTRTDIIPSRPCSPSLCTLLHHVFLLTFNITCIVFYICPSSLFCLLSFFPPFPSDSSPCDSCPRFPLVFECLLTVMHSFSCPFVSMSVERSDQSVAARCRVESLSVTLSLACSASFRYRGAREGSWWQLV